MISIVLAILLASGPVCPPNAVSGCATPANVKTQLQELQARSEAFNQKLNDDFHQGLVPENIIDKFIEDMQGNSEMFSLYGSTAMGEVAICEQDSDGSQCEDAMKHVKKAAEYMGNVEEAYKDLLKPQI